MNRARMLGVVGAVLASLLVFTPNASASAAPGGAVFNNPKGNHATQWRIVMTVNRAIRATPKGARIEIANYLWDSRASTDAVINARKRGVQVQVVLDGLARNHGTRRMAAALNRDNRKKVHGKHVKGGPDRSYVVFCKGACRNGGVPNHMKYYTFTRTGTAKNVVMVSSSNLNKGGAVKGYNDLYIVKERPQLLADFDVIHREMAADKYGSGYHQYVEGNIIARFYAKRVGPDPVMQDLAKVHCKGARGGAGRGGRTAINISMFRWNNARGFRIARKLVQLDGAGCDVSVIYGAPGRNVVEILRNSAIRGGIKLWDSRVDRNEDGKVDLRIHHKYTLISGNYGTDRSSWQVWTGSANWGEDLRAGDENTINVESRAAYRQYMANWTMVRNTAARRVPGPPATARILPDDL